ncbi:MAG: PilZ domain-containing protein [Pyrinomonadaceae bacterium]
MPELFRSLAAKLREYIKDRRHAERRKVELPVTVSLIEKVKKVNSRKPLATLRGHTLDISADGLAIVVSAIHIDGHYLVGEGRILLVELELPDGPAQIKVNPVRYERLDEEESLAGYLIGSGIAHISDDDRKRFMAYIAQLPV